jgi:uncharacterized protein (TIGR04255 family)
MSLAPVFYTLAQVQFNPIAQMSDYVDRLQEQLRRNGFPDFRDEYQFGLAIRRLEEAQPEFLSQKQRRWIFNNAECTEGYLLLANALVFHTTKYDTFTKFLEKTLFGLGLVHKIVELAYVERIGLRYLDAIVPMQDQDTLPQYLNASLLGLSAELGGSLKHSFTENMAVIEDGTLVVRALITEGKLALPPDLFPLQLQLMPRFVETNGHHAVLDADYFVEKRNRFEISEIEKQLKNAHAIITQAFKASVTDHARQRWS